MWPHPEATIGRHPPFMSIRRSGLRAKAAQPIAVCETPQAPLGSSGQYLSALGVYGFGAIEPVILAALVTEDPLLLIGASGTGKTYLLNSLSEALDLDHRHYNASLISFDDLVVFPYPHPDGTGVRFQEPRAGAEKRVSTPCSGGAPPAQSGNHARAWRKGVAAFSAAC